MALPVEKWAESVRAGDVRAVSRAITAIENHQPEAEALLRLLFPHTGQAYLTGVTGARRALGADVAEFVARVRRHTALPIAVGFGISAPEHVASLRDVADAVVVGSAALDAVSGAPAEGRPEALRAFVSVLAAAGKG